MREYGKKQMGRSAMSGTNLETVGRLLQEVAFEPEEAARLERAVMSVNSLVLAVARERLAFEDEPAAYALAVTQAKAP